MALRALCGCAGGAALALPSIPLSNSSSLNRGDRATHGGALPWINLQTVLAPTHGVYHTTQEVLDAENFVSTSQANAGYGTAMPSVGRRLLGEL